MEMDLRTKLCLQVGSLMVSNIELGHQVEGAQAQVAKMQADAKAVAEAQAKHDAAADARDQPSGAPAPIEAPPPNVQEVPASDPLPLP